MAREKAHEHIDQWNGLERYFAAARRAAAGEMDAGHDQGLRRGLKDFVVLSISAWMANRVDANTAF